MLLFVFLQENKSFCGKLRKISHFLGLIYFSRSFTISADKTSTSIKRIAILLKNSNIWTWENLSSVVCEKQRRRPACATAQSDQHLCYLLSGGHNSQACSMRNSTFLARLCSLGDCFESGFVGNPENSFCRDETHMLWVSQWARQCMTLYSVEKDITICMFYLRGMCYLFRSFTVPLQCSSWALTIGRSDFSLQEN